MPVASIRTSLPIHPAIAAALESATDDRAIGRRIDALAAEIAELRAALLQSPSPILTGPSVIAEYRRMTGGGAA